MLQVDFITCQEEDIVEDQSLRIAAKGAKMSEDNIEKCLTVMNDPSIHETLKKSTDDAIGYGVRVFASIGFTIREKQILKTLQ